MAKPPNPKEEPAAPDAGPLNCGIVMPISPIDGCSEQHWAEVKEILVEGIETAGFVAHLVSDAEDVGVIHSRIIQNLYKDPIVVCDVSGKNPNVMFELGLRLAFDKPTIIVKDDQTPYSFDTSSIEHLEYPRDLRFRRIVEFKAALKEKVKATYDKATSDPNYTTFLKHFGEFKVAKLETTEVSKDEFILNELKEMRGAIDRLTTSQASNSLRPPQRTAQQREATLRALEGSLATGIEQPWTYMSVPVNTRFPTGFADAIAARAATVGSEYVGGEDDNKPE